MLGHLVFGRYGAGSDRDEHFTRGQMGWMGRFVDALLHLGRQPRR